MSSVLAPEASTPPQGGGDLRVSHALDLLTRLTQIITEFAKKEEVLTRDLRNRRLNATRKFRETVEKLDARLSGQLEETESQFKQEEERISTIFKARADRVRRAHASGLRSLPKRAQEAKSKWFGELQHRKFRAERRQAADLKAADAAATEFGTRLAHQAAVMAGLEGQARKAFRGYGALVRMLAAPGQRESDERDHEELFAELQATLRTAEEQLGAFRQFLLARSFSDIPLPALIVPIIAVGIVLAVVLGPGVTAYAIAAGSVLVLLGVVALFHRIGFSQSRPTAEATANALAKARQLHAAAATSAERKREQDRQRAVDEFQETNAAIEEQWERADDVETEFLQVGRRNIEAQAPRIMAQIERLTRVRLAGVESERGQLAQISGDAAARKQQVTETHENESATLAAEEKSRWDELEGEWRERIVPILEEIGVMNAAAAARFPEWDTQLAEKWDAPMVFSSATRFGRLDVDLANKVSAKVAAVSLPQSNGQSAAGMPQLLSLPLALTIPEQGSLLFETNESGSAAMLSALNNIILRLLTTMPAGKLAFTIIDPVGLGQSFAGLMHLGDYEESLINRRIWTQRDQIDERLGELSDHIEKVIQMYLRNEYATITEYNAQAGSIAEKYHYLVVADFPAQFSDEAARRLQSIAVSGPRCGIFTLIHWDKRQPLPDGFSADELRKNSVCIRQENGALVLGKAQVDAGAALLLDAPPPPELALELIHKIGKASIDSNRVEVPFSHIAPKPEEMWTHETTSELRIAIGRTGATKLQYLAIGKGTRQHALFAGKTGSGKSTLFHVIITNLALACSPEQVEFYLIDFKKGVEFKCYATKRLPHARVIAIESDREFGLSVLQRVDDELKRRGDLFRKLGVQDVAGYKRAGGTEPMPRTLLLIDEFQEFFVEDDAVAQGASLLFDRIVRQGRAFGIHVLLGSQTLGGAFTLARATMGQMVIRVALQCNEADAYLIMDENNSAPRLLSRPGEGIYNDAAGAVEGNSPFQVVWLPDEERDVWLEKVRALAEQRGDGRPSPIVFEGNAPADIRENDLLRKALETGAEAAPATARAWLGAPNSIKGPTEAAFHRQSGNHLLIVGQRDEAALTLIGVSMLSLAAQFPAGSVRFVLFDSTNPGSRDEEFLAQIVRAIPHPVTVARGHEIETAMTAVASDLKARISGEQGADAPRIFVFIHGLQRFKKLRHEDDFSFSSSDDGGASPGAQLGDLITEGSSLGIHVIASIDTFNNVNRFMSRKALSEFEMRVLFQMSANDSASLIDSPKASNLGLHRALFYNEHEGHLETFRPYAMPGDEWIGHAAESLARRA